MTTAPTLLSASLAAAQGAATPVFGWTGTAVGWAALAIFVLAYALVVLEERIHLRKSKPVMIGAALIWGLIAFKAKLRDLGMTEDEVEEYIDDLAGDADADED